MQVQDAYKLIYQGAMGPEHMVATRQEFSRRLEAEFAAISAQPGGPMFDPIRADQALFRVNLRPYKAQHADTNALLSCLLQTSRLYPGDMAELQKNWAGFIQLCERSELRIFPLPDVLQLNHRLEQEDFPPIHHSEAYRQAYQPAYRLVAAQFIPELRGNAAS